MDEAEREQWKADAQAKVRGTFERMCLVAESFDAAAWRKALDRSSVFHNYSFLNQLSIHCAWAELRRIDPQRPALGCVAGKTRWWKLQRNIKPGEWINGLPIFVPITRIVRGKPKAEQTKLAFGEAEEQLVRVFRFKLAAVYDESQTQMRDGTPAPPVELEDRSWVEGVTDPRQAIDKLVAYGTQQGWRIELRRLALGEGAHIETRGFCEMGAKQIVVATRLADGTTVEPAMQFKTLVHELAHAHLHADNYQGAVSEMEAESVAYCVAAAIGLDTSGYSIGYVSTYADRAASKAERGRLLIQIGNRVAEASRVLVGALGRPSQKIEVD